MSQENVDLVRRFNAAHEGEDIIPALRSGVERLGPEPTSAEVLAFWAEDPGWRYVDPELEWDVAAIGAVGTTAIGPMGVAGWWADWVEAWESYVYRIVDYRDLGEWILTPVDIAPEGAAGFRSRCACFRSSAFATARSPRSGHS